MRDRIVEIQKGFFINTNFISWPRPNTHIQFSVSDGAEFLVLKGEFIETGEPFKEQSWLRLPQDAKMDGHAGSNGCEVWVKTDHLRGPFILPSGTAVN